MGIYNPPSVLQNLTVTNNLLCDQISAIGSSLNIASDFNSPGIADFSLEVNPIFQGINLVGPIVKTPDLPTVDPANGRFNLWRDPVTRIVRVGT
jgi:hypothetical protein